MNFCILPAKPSPGTLEELATHLPGNWRTNIKDHEGIWGTLISSRRQTGLPTIFSF